MKSHKSLYIALGISLCVGVISIFYISRRRKKNGDNQKTKELKKEVDEEKPVESINVNEQDGENALEPNIEKVYASRAYRERSEVSRAGDHKSSLHNGVTDTTPKFYVDSKSSSESNSSSKERAQLGKPGDETLTVNSETSGNTANHQSNHPEPKPSRTEDGLSIKASGVSQEISPMQVADTLMRLSKPGSLQSVSYSDACVLKYTVSFVQGKERARILETIAGAASFSKNLPILTASGCLQSLQDLLKQTAADRRFCSENEKIALLHALTNVSGSEENQQNLKSSVADLFSLSEGQEESRVGLACLCVIANLTLTNFCHPEVAEFGTRIYELLEDEDTALLKQVLTILLNLCCESSTVPLLLTAKAPSEMATFVTRSGTIGKSNDLLIKWLRILRNLYKVIRENGITAETLTLSSNGDLDGSMYSELQMLRLQMKPCVFLLCHNKESHGLAANAKLLYEYLETTT